LPRLPLPSRAPVAARRLALRCRAKAERPPLAPGHRGRSVGSHPVGTDARAGGEALSDRLQRVVGATDDPVRAGQRETGDDILAPGPGADEPAVAKTGEVRADARLRLAGGRDELPDRPLTVPQDIEDVQPGRVAQDPEEAGGRAAVDRGLDGRI